MDLRISTKLIWAALSVVTIGIIFGVWTDRKSFGQQHVFLLELLANLLGICLSIVIGALVVDASRRRAELRLWQPLVWAARPALLNAVRQEEISVFTVYRHWLGDGPWMQYGVKGPPAPHSMVDEQICDAFDRRLGHKARPTETASEIPIPLLLLIVPLIPVFMLVEWLGEFPPIARRRHRRRFDNLLLEVAQQRAEEATYPSQLDYPSGRKISATDVKDSLGAAVTLKLQAGLQQAKLPIAIGSIPELRAI